MSKVTEEISIYKVIIEYVENDFIYARAAAKIGRGRHNTRNRILTFCDVNNIGPLDINKQITANGKIVYKQCKKIAAELETLEKVLNKCASDWHNGKG
ncbi:MAG: hypothetical protein RR646_04310 [Erysipelotrichaceae bacterium]